jgi:hypothetical protein
MSEEERRMLRLRYLEYLIWLDMLPLPARPKNKRWDGLIGLAICLPLYGYGVYKLLGG